MRKSGVLALGQSRTIMTSATVVMDYSAGVCVGEHLSRLALHTQKRFTVKNGILQCISLDARQE